MEILKTLVMMMKPKNYMYATIKGSLTDNDGVFSGFSASDYLELNNFNNIETNNIELCIKYTPTTLTTTRLLATADSGTTFTGIVVGNSSPNYFRFFVYGNNTQYVVVSSVTAQANTSYYIVAYRKGNKIGIKVSSDGINYTTDEISIPDNLSLTNANKLYFGINKNSGASFINGSIDLNQSYIKINNTKYQLQAVVGYTVVGSPTITDNVVSGFSGSNYLTLPQLPQDSTEIQIDFTLGNTISSDFQSIFLTGLFAISKPQTNIIGIYDNSSSSWKEIIPQNNVVANSHYIINIKKNENNLSFFYSKDGGSFINSLNWTSNNTYTANIIIGTNTNYNDRYFKGTFNLNNTYIKKANKLWFNGQEE